MLVNIHRLGFIMQYHLTAHFLQCVEGQLMLYVHLVCCFLELRETDIKHTSYSFHYGQCHSEHA